MKLLASLTLLLPALHVAADTQYFGLRTGTQLGAPVVVKSRENNFSYHVVYSGSGVEPEQFHFGAGGTIIDLDGDEVLLNPNTGDFINTLTDDGTRGFYFDADGKLAKHNGDGKKWYLCHLLCLNGFEFLQFSNNREGLCEETEVYRA